MMQGIPATSGFGIMTEPGTKFPIHPTPFKPDRVRGCIGSVLRASELSIIVLARSDPHGQAPNWEKVVISSWRPPPNFLHYFTPGPLARDLLVPIVHGTTYEALREVSPLLGSRSGLSKAGPRASRDSSPALVLQLR